MKPNLILITTSFPFGVEESGFLTSEIQYLLNNFRLTIVSRNIKDEQYVKIPDEVSIYRYNAKKKYCISKLCISALLSRSFYKEVFIIVKNGFCLAMLKKALKINMRAIHFSYFLKGVREKIDDSKVIFYTYWNEYSALGTIMSKYPGDIQISRLHGGDLYKLPTNGFYQPYKKYMVPYIDKYVFISETGANYFEGNYERLGSKRVIARLGSKPIKISYEFTDRNFIKIYSFSYCRDIKRINLIIDALSNVVDMRIEWTHIGGRYLYNEIRQYALNKLEKKQNVKYRFVGEMKNEDALSFISQTEFDFLVNTSSTEGLPVTMMEAMAMKIPVIGTNVGGVSEIVKDSYNGYLMSKNFDVKYLVQIWKNYLSLSFEKKRQLRNNAFYTWNELYNSDKNYKKFSNYLLELFNQKN